MVSANNGTCEIFEINMELRLI